MSVGVQMDSYAKSKMRNKNRKNKVWLVPCGIKIFRKSLDIIVWRRMYSPVVDAMRFLISLAIYENI